MRALIQRVREASVTADGEFSGSIQQGLLVLLGVAPEDDAETAAFLAERCAGLRIFEDAAGKMNRSLADVNGAMLVISQFTLLANYRHGNRPDFLASAKPEEANRLYEYFRELLSRELRRVECGIFGADMKVSLTNDGPVTICMDSEVLKKKK